ncbi:MAG: hypothetical protein BGO69_05355 [Bacteroidetes bacterium 46-16]|nr:MAG: hypothetical protein BGO69_05355 [Bacteroidetes bacterium 46-16]
MTNEIKSNADLKIIVPIIIVITLLLCAAIFIVNYLGDRADMFIVSSGFTGKITVIYGQADGIAEKNDGEHRIFDIPQSGILSTQSIYKDVWNSYYYRMPDGKLIPLAQGNPHGMRGMPTGVYSDVDTVFVADVNTMKVDINGKQIYVTTYKVEKSGYK